MEMETVNSPVKILRKGFSFLLFVAFLSGCSANQQADCPVVPRPEFVQAGAEISDEPKDTVIQIKPELGPEAYTIKIREKTVRISAGDSAGVFYAFRTINQLRMNSEASRKWTIKDKPRFRWRGYMLDESRHFFGKEYVKEILDMMSELKLNIFHWHLTDEPGWRVEIKAYPELTTVGAKGNYSNPEAPARFYTREEIQEIVDYAAQRHITVVPEIDMPGHATSSNRAYPQFNGGGSEKHPDFTFNPGKEETYSYLTDILREVAGLFPGQYIHIGGDEVSFGRAAWENDPDVLALMKRESLADLDAMEAYFIRRMADSVKTLGKTPLCWDDVLEAGLGHDETGITWWRHDRLDHLAKALEEGCFTILCPRKPMYFDFVQHDSHTTGRRWDGFCPLEDVYAFPDSLEMPDGYMPAGMQANLWSEQVSSIKRAEFMTFPRIIALAEAAWTSAENKDFTDFSARLETFYTQMDNKGIYYFDHRNPTHNPEPPGPVKGVAAD
ncbi:MAG: beta-N-acetylhexosaminidase [Bacteroidales bacterium]|nr:beta-N-acetylhexosaminidase [Bacteroidales bacterium]